MDDLMPTDETYGLEHELELDIRELRGATPAEMARRLVERGWSLPPVARPVVTSPQKMCAACGAALGLTDTHWNLGADAYVCPSQAHVRISIDRVEEMVSPGYWTVSELRGLAAIPFDRDLYQVVPGADDQQICDGITVFAGLRIFSYPRRVGAGLDDLSPRWIVQPLSRIDALRVAIDEAVSGLNAVWFQTKDGWGKANDLLEEVIALLQKARTDDDIANGRDWLRPEADFGKPERDGSLADWDDALGGRDDFTEARSE